MKRKVRARNLDPLHPNTLAALGRRMRFLFQDAAEGEIAVSGQVAALEGEQILFAAFQANGVEPELVELLISIRACRGDDSLRETYQDSLDDLGRVARIAVAVDDSAFPAQLAFAMEFARDPESRERWSIYRAWRHLNSGVTIRDELSGNTVKLVDPARWRLKELAEEIHGDTIAPKTFDDHLAAMGIKLASASNRGRPRNAG